MMASVLGVTLNYSMQKSQQQRSATEAVMMDLLVDLGRIALFTTEYAELQSYIENVVEDPFIETVILSDRKDNIAVSSNPKLYGLKLSEYSNTASTNDENSMHWTVKEISNSSGVLGTLAVEFSNKSLFEINREVWNLGITIALISMFLIAIIGSLIGHILTRRLEVLKAVAHNFSQGYLGTRTGFSGKDEVSIVGHTFDDMAERVSDQMNELFNSREKLEQRVKERTDELASARDEAIKATRSKSAFLANMSHEIRTPLTAIIGFTESMQENNLTESDREEYLHIINRSSKHLLQIINDILDLSKIEADKLSIELIKVNPADILSDVESLLRLMAEDKGLSININYKSPIPVEIASDPVRLKQILINLCNNAVKFTHTGSVNLNIEYDTNHQLIKFEVMDTGIGMTAEQIGNLFQAFTQADSSTTRKYGGTGLGLHLSKQLAKKLGGDIIVTSTPGSGSCFSLSIPVGSMAGVKLIDGADHRERRHSPVAINKHDFSGTNILLAEDNEDNQRYISTLLKITGAHFDIAENGLQAVELATNGNYDLILMDMQMPEMNGLEATGKLRRQNYQKPIIALTANYASSDIETYLKGGCNAHLAKPIERQIFYETIQNQLGTSKQTNETAIPKRPLITDNFDDAIAEAINMFIQRLPGTFTDICEQYEAGNKIRLRELIHDLKGTSGNFGYDKLFAIARDMEELLKNDFLDEFGSLLHEAERIVQSIILHPEQSSMEL